MGLIINVAKAAKALLVAATKKFADVFNRKARKALPRIELRIKEILREEFFASPEYDSLVGSGPFSLDAHFGFVKGTSKTIADNIVDALINSLIVQLDPFKASGKVIKGGFFFRAIKSDFSDVLDHSDAVVITEKGKELPWLKWLLLRGNRIIINDYHIWFSPPHGRSEKAHMEPTGSWRVPPQYAGTPKNNWITRVTDKANIRIAKIIREELGV